MKRLICIVAGLSLVACEDHRDRASLALREAEMACGLRKGMLPVMGQSDDPRRTYPTSEPVPLTVTTGAIGNKGEIPYDCLARFKSSQGYRIEQIITD
jgi:hypothetical protein